MLLLQVRLVKELQKPPRSSKIHRNIRDRGFICRIHQLPKNVPCLRFKVQLRTL